jgi:hypothetical protein
MNKTLTLSALALTLLPLTANAAPMHHAMKAPAKTAATMYQCQKCHMKVSAATAKKDGYKDPMDGGKLVPMTKAPAKAAPSGKPMGSMKM